MTGQTGRLREGHENRHCGEEFYPGSTDRITDPFYHTTCTCGKEFLRIHRVQTVRCPRCGKVFDAK